MVSSVQRRKSVSFVRFIFPFAGVEGVLEPLAPDFTSSEFVYWKKVFLSHRKLRVPWHVVLGNHDYMGNWRAQIAFTNSTANPEGIWRMPDRNYVLHKNFASFLMFDANACQFAVRRVKKDAVEVFHKDKKWLRDAIASCRASGSRWIVLVQHHPMYTDGRGHEKEAACLRSNDGLDLERVVLEAGGVDLVIAGNKKTKRKSAGVKIEIGHEHMMMAKTVGKTLHVSAGASIESVFYKGRRKDPEMDWREEGGVGFLACEATQDSLTVNFVQSSDLRRVKTFQLKK